MTYLVYIKKFNFNYDENDFINDKIPSHLPISKKFESDCFYSLGDINSFN